MVRKCKNIPTAGGCTRSKKSQLQLQQCFKRATQERDDAYDSRSDWWWSCWLMHSLLKAAQLVVRLLLLRNLKPRNVLEPRMSPTDLPTTPLNYRKRNDMRQIVVLSLKIQVSADRWINPLETKFQKLLLLLLRRWWGSLQLRVRHVHKGIGTITKDKNVPCVNGSGIAWNEEDHPCWWFQSQQD